MFIVLLFSTWYLHYLTSEHIRPLSVQLTQTFEGSVILSRFVSTLFVGVSIITASTISGQFQLTYFGLMVFAWGALMGAADVVAFQWLKRKKQEVEHYRKKNQQKRV